MNRDWQDNAIMRGARKGWLEVVIRGLAVCMALAGWFGTAGADDFLPGLGEIEFRENFEADTSGNAIIFEVENTTAFPVKGLNLRPEMPAQFLTLDGITPNDIDLAPGEKIEITVEFSVREDAPEGAEDVIGFHFDTHSDDDVPIPRYRMIAVIEANEDEDEQVAAQCNSAVESGGDEGGGAVVDLGGFVGPAGFSWEMYTVKDQMNVTVGGVSKTTGCVSGSGTIEFQIPPGASTASVEVVPNCEGTTGTDWNFTFECPLTSEVTADGTGAELTSSDESASGTPVNVAGTPAQPGTAAPSALGQPVALAPPSPPPVMPNGQTRPETEENNNRSEATGITLGDRVDGTIWKRGDHDVYRFATPYQGELTVSFPVAPAGLNMAFRVLNEQGAQVWGWQVAPTQGAVFSAWADLKSPGTYFIEVADGSNDAESFQPYAMQTSFIPTADPAEPNDTRSAATELAWNAALKANILPRGDHDYYRVTADHQGQLSLSFTDVPPNLNMAFRVLNEQGAQVWGWQSAPTLGAPFSAWADLQSTGIYFLEVVDGSNDSRSAIPYHFYASLDPTPDLAEPNGSRAQATPASPGQVVSASILPRSDADFYRLDLAQQGQVTVDFEQVPQNLNMAFRVLNQAGAQVTGWQAASANGQTFAAWADIKHPGIYFLEVRDGSNDARSKDTYQMRLTFYPTADPGEPNDGRETATPLAFEESVRAAILPRNDVDYYRIQAPDRGELTARFDPIPANLNVAFRVLNQAGAQVWGWQSAPANGEPFAAWADLGAPGIYFLEVRDGSNDARSKDAYGLTLSFARAPDPAEPNDGREHATRLDLGQVVQASIVPRNDADFYRLDLPRAGQLSVQFDRMPPGLNMAFRVLNSSGAQVKGWQSAPSNGSVFSAGAEIKGQGTYFLEVRDGSNDARSPEPYTMEATFH